MLCGACTLEYLINWLLHQGREAAPIVLCCPLCRLCQVDAFLLPPAGGGLDESKRRAALLARRTEWMALGIPEDEYPQSMRDDQLL
jgi:hypothetical protein